MKNKLQVIRWEKGWSQEYLARKSGGSRSMISKLENSIIENPTIDVAYRLCVALSVDIWDLFIPRH